MYPFIFIIRQYISLPTIFLKKMKQELKGERVQDYEGQMRVCRKGD